MFKKLLFATSASPACDNAAKVAFDLEMKWEAKLFILHVLGVPGRSFSLQFTDVRTGEREEISQDYVDWVKEEMNNDLREAARGQQRLHPHCDRGPLPGNPAAGTQGGRGHDHHGRPHPRGGGGRHAAPGGDRQHHAQGRQSGPLPGRDRKPPVHHLLAAVLQHRRRDRFLEGLASRPSSGHTSSRARSGPTCTSSTPSTSRPGP